jgi:hypothetical protein
MYTRQANQIQTALRSAIPNQGSAQDLVQALCNCAQTLEHRGPTQFTYQDPWSGLYPTITPPPGQIQPYVSNGVNAFPPISAGNVTVNMPPWVPVRWDNIPFIDVPQGAGGSIAGNAYIFNSSAPSFSLSATAQAGGPIVAPNHGFSGGDAFQFALLSGGNPLTTNTTYYVQDPTQNNFYAASSPGGTAITLTQSITDAVLQPPPAGNSGGASYAPPYAPYVPAPGDGGSYWPGAGGASSVFVPGASVPGGAVSWSVRPMGSWAAHRNAGRRVDWAH